MQNERINTREIIADKEPFIMETKLNGLLIIKRPFNNDDRGAFQEDFRVPDIEKIIGRKIILQQGQHSFTKPGVVRGIHSEPQDKIITPFFGRIVSVIVDLRPKSDTFKQWIMIDFDLIEPAPEMTSLFVPEGMGNSFCAYRKEGDPIPGIALYRYSVNQIYNPKFSGVGVRFDDSELGIPWPVDNPIVSDRDKNMPTLKEFVVQFRQQ